MQLTIKVDEAALLWLSYLTLEVISLVHSLRYSAYGDMNLTLFGQ